ncbi:MAG TPA: hypothetical protein VK171_05210 [Fimbriimonas sp.]|nr:hypothetical protein [Fimbriimonas sp.]
MKLGLPLFFAAALVVTLSSVVYCSHSNVKAPAPDQRTLAQREQSKSLYATVVRGDGDLADPKTNEAADQLIAQIQKDGYDGSAGSHAMVLCKFPQFREKMQKELPELFDSYNLAAKTHAANIVQVMDIEGFESDVSEVKTALKASDAEIDQLNARFIDERD